MTRKQTTIVIILAVVILGGMIVGLLVRRNTNPVTGGENGGSTSVATSSSKNTGTSAKPTFTTEVPKNAVLTVPSQTIKIVDQPNAAPGAKFTSFQITVTKKGYSPSSITVKKGDTVEINLTAQDGSYDIFSGSAGFYASASPNKPGKISFGVSTSGTFSFSCRDLCPSSGKIYGELIVMP